MKFRFEVEVEVERISGKFAPKADIADALLSEIEEAVNAADVSGCDVDGESEYEVVTTEVTYVE